MKEAFKKLFITTDKFNGGLLMVWRCFLWNGNEILVFTDGAMKGKNYNDIVEENVEQILVKMALVEEFIF